MKNTTRFYLIIACVIVLFDVTASFASKLFGFDYTALKWVSWAIYLGSGYWGCKNYSLRTGMIAGLVAGLSDSTLGWALSTAIGPTIPFHQPRLTPLLVSVVIVIVAVKSTFIGAVGALFGEFIRRRLRPVGARP
jgi:hypothetical protein